MEGSISISMCENDKELLGYGIIRKSMNPPPFLLKTYMLVDDPATDDIISWNDGGTAFVVWQPAELARDLLPTLFKHSNFSSFVRQLNTYGFRKVATSRWEFSNDMFRRGKKDLLGQIRRRKSAHHQPQPLSISPRNHKDEDRRSTSTSSSSSSELNTLVDENKRLKKENGVLSSELTTMKKKCKDLLDLVTTYANGRKDGRESDEDDKQWPKLFGVRLQVNGEGGIRKRNREETEVFEKTRRVLLSQSCK